MILKVGPDTIPVEVSVPDGPVAVEDVLPVFHGLSNLFAVRAEEQAKAAGRTVSCRAGCGACCRQLVPITGAEARFIARLVQDMPEPRQSQVRQRFEDALDALERAEVLHPRDDPEDEKGRAVDYFNAGVACPFLEDEACSIHPDRPLICREYLVTSPPVFCASLSGTEIERLPFEGEPSLAVLAADPRDGWLPLVLALVSDSHAPPSLSDRTAPEILRDVIGRLA